MNIEATKLLAPPSFLGSPHATLLRDPKAISTGRNVSFPSVAAAVAASTIALFSTVGTLGAELRERPSEVAAPLRKALGLDVAAASRSWGSAMALLQSSAPGDAAQILELAAANLARTRKS